MGRDRGRAWPAGGALGQTVAASASLEATELRSHILGNSWSLLALSESGESVCSGLRVVLGSWKSWVPAVSSTQSLSLCPPHSCWLMGKPLGFDLQPNQT